MLGQSITKNAVLLAVFAMSTALLLAGTYLLTQDRIAEEIRKAEEKALLQIVPRERHNNSMLDDTITVGADISALGLRTEKQIYRARQDGRVVAAIIPATARDGYSGDIDLVIGVNADGTVAGVRTLSHKETPGLGDKVDLAKSDWILNFTGRSLRDPLPGQWAVTKDKGVFDSFTGATITPRAVVATVKGVLEYAGDNSEVLFGIPATVTPEGAQE
ncbi:electron transport complex subunit RsxG [Pseudohalioglobus lutimaris]|uniref:Ion-translocating oxidoreductase complex subunit G n=1 Tax=Pseudohalioglobus lutimaris TaxID=1737061 RepID=A0A2N5WWW1_9GAMM|nr:electron transport complex subunit RsxG [Pseudohalioglobus lutimaris]PLW66739.1 electron transport complex subunit RsxG [Pseudohalioglobus lutimaris]